jgi:hypothetical protein|tara:strand:+ start:218 stop:505 length:288 start_codon:yes stop_codon:yes gene_type:complete
MLNIDQIINIVSSNLKNYWFSRKNEDNTYENIDLDEVQQGDIVWFNKDADVDDMKEVKKTLAQMNMHMYSKSLYEDGKLMKSKSGAFSFLILPNQ